MIRLGPAGLPTTLPKERKNTIEGIKEVKNLGLNAMEIEFVRNIYLNEKQAEEVGKIAKELDVKLSIHAPYYINLLSEKKEVVKKSKFFILRSLELAEIMQAEFVVVHAAYYGKLSKQEAFEKMIEITGEILDEMKKKKIKNSVLLYETMAKTSQFADFQTLLEFKDRIKSKNFGICIDFAHIFAYNDGKIDYDEIFDLAKFDYYHTHFSNMKFNLKTKKFIDEHEPINSHPSFKELAEVLIERKIENITIISESPILEQDSLKMKKILEKLGYKF
ncbi:MAG: TIM barrel protein [Candidatus Aenigmatarchaeota archaeon]